jgi:hypothetical protein
MTWDDPITGRESLRELLQTFTYRPGWSFYLERDTLVIRANVLNTDNPKETIRVDFGIGLPFPTPHKFDWTRWLFDQIMVVEDHEAREFFKIGGVKVFDPHA